MNRKGFTFEQIAVLILVIMGLTVAVVLAATQLSKSGSQLSQLGGSSGVGADQAADAAGKLGTICISKGGFCVTDKESDGTTKASTCEYVKGKASTSTKGPYKIVSGETISDCPTNNYCCKN